MRRAALLTILALTACTRELPEPVSFRLDGRPIASAALFDPTRFAGDWQVVGAYPGAVAGVCVPTALSVDQGPVGVSALRWFCPDGRAFDLTGQPAGPGRYRMVDPATAQDFGPVWVLWVDEGYRTAVIGRPDGAFGLILNRDAALPPDRALAARVLLDFNGYDLTRLRM